MLSGASNFDDAVRRASQLYYNGMSGYLATVTSQAEYAFLHYNVHVRRAWVATRNTGSGWMFAAGPEKGQTASFILSSLVFTKPSASSSDPSCIYIIESGMDSVSCALTDIVNYVVEFECASPNVLVDNRCVGKLMFL